jgi:molybdopterin molybdotransferase
LSTIHSVTASFPDRVLPYPEAAQVVFDHIRALTESHPVESVPLLESLGRILTEPVAADRDHPPFARATRDGFACHVADLNPARSLQIMGQLRSGQLWTGPNPKAGEVIEIMTGAPVPEGLDCVIMIEHVTVEGRSIRPIDGRKWVSGENIVPRGAEARKGSLLIAPGTRIQPQQIAIGAACGKASLPVYARPRVAILATGDELVPVIETPLPHQIRNSNSYSLAAQVTKAGGNPVILPPAPDVLSALEESIRGALPFDLILLSGGVSMGKYDFVEQALANLGAEFFFTGVRMQPGKPVVFGRLPYEDGHRYFFALPGNPVSTMVTFALFVAPLLARLSGQSADACRPDFREGRLAETIEVKPGLTRFLPARSDAGIDGTRVSLRPWQGSGDIAAASEANSFVVLPDGSGTLAAGTQVAVLHL